MQHDRSAKSSAGDVASTDGGLPGKRARTDAIVQRKAGPLASGSTPDLPVAAIGDDPFGLHLPAVQRTGDGGATGADVHAAAARGVDGPGAALPHAAAIQAGFGPAHDVSRIEAHVGGAAADAAHAIGATAYATGHHVAFAAAPDLHTAAHEAAHVVQQARGVSLYGGVGQAGDGYEQHADAVADRVVAGRSAADLLGAGGDGGAGAEVQRQVAPGAVVQREAKPGATGDKPTNVSKDTHEVMDDFAARDGEQTVVLETSTSTTGIGGKVYFEPDTLYNVDLDLNFFTSLASATGKGLLDLAAAAGPKQDDYLDVGGTKLTGKKPQSLTFVLRGVLQPDNKTYSSSKMAVHAANNGMLNLARLASDFISALPAARGGALPKKLALVCKVNFGTNAGDKDEDARKENSLTTIPPWYKETWNAVAGELTSALLGGLGFAGEFVSTDLYQADFKAKTKVHSARSMAEWAEQRVNKSWHDSDARRTFVTTPVAGIADAIMAKLAAAVGDATPDADYDPAAVNKGSKYKGQQATSDSTKRSKVNPNIRKDVIAFAKDIASKVVLPQITAQLGGNMKKNVSAEFAKVADAAAASWATAYAGALEQAGWVTWYDDHVTQTVRGVASGGTAGLDVKHVGSAEGYVANPLRTHAGEPPVE